MRQLGGLAPLLLPALDRVARPLPSRAARGVGAGLGELTRLTDPAGRERARAALAAAFPRLDADAIGLRMRRAYRHQGRIACDDLAIPRHGAERFCRRLTIDGWEHLETAEAAGRGAILLVSPLGSPEVARLALALYRSPLLAPSDDQRPPSSSMRRLQQVAGAEPLPRETPLARLAEALAGGARILFELRPAAPGEASCAVTLFGRQLQLGAAPGELALRAGAPVALVNAMAERGGYRLRVEPPILAGEGEIRSIHDLGVRCAEGLEHGIRQAPAQWPWMSASWGLQ